MRIDLYLFENGFAQSRNKAAEMVKNKEVFVNHKCITKTSFEVDDGCEITLESRSHYVSRAGKKLAGFLLENSLSIQNKVCLDIGCSTGGFVQVLLEAGAKKVVGVDVGSEQLHPSLRENAKVILFEQMDIRDFKSDIVFDIVTCDVSFIGIENVLESINKFANESIIILFKPQFQVGKDAKRSKKGVVKDAKAIQKVMYDFEAQTFALGWHLLKKQDSILKGKEGNIETFYYFTKR